MDVLVLIVTKLSAQLICFVGPNKDSSYFTLSASATLQCVSMVWILKARIH